VDGHVVVMVRSPLDDRWRESTVVAHTDEAAVKLVLLTQVAPELLQQLGLTARP